MKLASFTISGAFAAFRDPSLTSNQTVQYIPSKSAVVGILGAMVGIQRSASLTKPYGEDYVAFFNKIKIGIKLQSKPSKVTFFTNHRSLKEPKTKPYKTELVENPKYEIYVNADNDTLGKISNTIKSNQFKYSPYLGHAYCPAIVENLQMLETRSAKPVGRNTQCVVLDPSETYDDKFNFYIEQDTDDGSVIVERHIHHFYKESKLDGRVLKHWIPVDGADFAIEKYSDTDLTEFYELGDHVICMY